jgi:hypothetical protein
MPAPLFPLFQVFFDLNSVSPGLGGVAFYTANANRKATQGAKKHA